MRAIDVAHVRFAAPDLDRMERFVSDFGLQPFRERCLLYAHGSGPAPFVHVTEVGEPGFLALGLVAQSLDDLQELAAREGVPVAASPHPGGGMMAALRDPDNYLVEIIANQDVRPAASLPASYGWNDAREKARIRAAKRVAPGPATVVRLGHVVLGVSDFRVSEAWYKERFGFITSDEIVAPDGTAIGAFLRCDRQDQLTDHHSLFLIQGRGAAFNHAAFEVVDTDDLFVGHDWLRTAGWQAHWGIGRHVLGSQIFDYWRDPWGHTLEHWTDGDLLIAADGSRRADLSELRAVQWGPTAPN